MEDDTYAEEVALLIVSVIVAITSEDLGSNEPWRADVNVDERGFSDALRETEVDKFDRGWLRRVIEHDILRLQISVHYTLLMDVTKTLQELQHDVFYIFHQLQTLFRRGRYALKSKHLVMESTILIEDLSHDVVTHVVLVTPE